MPQTYCQHFLKNKYSTTDELVGPDCPMEHKVIVLISLEKEKQSQKRRFLKDMYLFFVHKMLSLENNLDPSFYR